MLTALLPFVVWIVTAAATEPAVIRPVDQRLELELNPTAASWSGSLLATLELPAGARRIELRFSGPVVSRVEMKDATGAVDLAWGAEHDSLLLIEARRDLAPGSASLNIGFEGGWRDAVGGPGQDTLHAVVRDAGLLRIRMRQGAGQVFPAWPAGTPTTPWTILVHAPKAYEVRVNANRTSREEREHWRSWTYRTKSRTPADSLRVTVQPVSAKK